MPPSKKVTGDEQPKSVPNASNTTLGGASQPLSGRGKKTASSHSSTNGITTANPVAGKDDPLEGRTASGQPAVGMDWQDQELGFLNDYRRAHSMNVNPAFISDENHFLLTNRRGIGRQSPTTLYGKLHKNRRKTSKSTLAHAVRKDFNSRAINEMATAVEMMYSVRHKDRLFKLRQSPLKHAPG